MRTFIAIELPPNVKQRVQERQRSLQRLLHELTTGSQPTGEAFRWTPADNLHLTLRFLGETSVAQRKQMETALAEIAAAFPVFQLAIQATGAFLDLRRPNIIWLDFVGDLSVLAPVQHRIELAAQQAGFTAEERAFKPHLTLARAQKNAAPATLARAGEILRTVTTTPAPPGDPFPVTAIYLIHSDLRPAGPIYTPLATFALGQRAG